MLTLFSIPKAFKGHTGVIQRNAIASWKRLNPEIDIVLIGDEEGTAEVARNYGVRHIAEVRRNEFNTPTMDDIFKKGHEGARYDLLCYVNADILLMQDFIKAASQLKNLQGKFLVVGGRWNVDVGEPVNFEVKDWEEKLRRLTLEKGKYLSGGIDYFMFRKGLYQNIPPLAIGRYYFDIWLVKQALSLHVPVVDASQRIMAVHQNHDYSHVKTKAGQHVSETFQVCLSVEAKRNAELAGITPYWNLFWNAMAWHTHYLSKTGKVKRFWAPKLQFLFTAPYFFYLFFILGPSHAWRKKIGLTHGHFLLLREYLIKNISKRRS